MQAIVMPDGTVSLGIVRQTGKQEVANVDGDIHGQPDVRSVQRERLPEQFLYAGCEPGHSKGVSLAQLFLLLLPALARPIV
jgi:hypothetical protein